MASPCIRFVNNQYEDINLTIQVCMFMCRMPAHMLVTCLFLYSACSVCVFFSIHPRCGGDALSLPLSLSVSYSAIERLSFGHVGHNCTNQPTKRRGACMQSAFPVRALFALQCGALANKCVYLFVRIFV